MKSARLLCLLQTILMWMHRCLEYCNYHTQMLHIADPLLFDLLRYTDFLWMQGEEMYHTILIDRNFYFHIKKTNRGVDYKKCLIRFKNFVIFQCTHRFGMMLDLCSLNKLARILNQTFNKCYLPDNRTQLKAKKKIIIKIY